MNLDSLRLMEHPEGGRFREVYRSTRNVTLEDARTRSSLTHIYFHLQQGEVSKFHRVEQEEVWNLYQGGPLRLWMLEEETGTLSETVLDAKTLTHCAVIPAGIWQAAEPLDGEVLVGCSVAPGFEFADFQLISQEGPLADTARKHNLERFL